MKILTLSGFLGPLFCLETSMELTVVLGLAIMAVFALTVLYFEGVLGGRRAVIISCVLVISAMLVRGAYMGHRTLDYENFLAVWVDFFRNNGGGRALSRSIGNYNVPYLYFLALFSYCGVPDLYLIKLLSVFFDVVLAWAVLRLVRVCRGGGFAPAAGFFLTLFLPTVVLNGACWGQCDSIYGAFALLGVCFALERRPVLSVVCVALSFAFKLQAVFIMPVYLVFLFTGRMKWKHLLVFPLTYFIVVLPAVATGRPLLDTLLLYFRQAGSVGDALNYNSSSVFAFVRGDVDRHFFSLLGIAGAAAFLVLVYVWLFLRRKDVTERALLCCSLLICIGVPFCLPHMHDRYFFIADVLALTLAAVVPGMAAVPALVSFGSLLGYHAYLKMRYLLPMRYGALALVLAMLLTVFCLDSTLRTPSFLERKEAKEL